MNFVADIIAKLAISFLQFWVARNDFKNSIEKGIAIENLKRINDALEFKMARQKSPPNSGSDPFGDFSVRDESKQIKLRDNDSRPPEA